MNNISEKQFEDKTAIVFISASAGEVDWVLPIIDFLRHKQCSIVYIFLSNRALQSVESNQMIKDFIFNNDSKISTYFCGGFFYETIEKYAYLCYRFFLKFKLIKLPIFSNIFYIINFILRLIYIKNLPSTVPSSIKNNYWIFSEYPSLRRPRDSWIKQKFYQSTFFYFPHSPHVYSDQIDQKYSEFDQNNNITNNFLLLGHPADFSAIKQDIELQDGSLTKVFLGHPKYSSYWLKDLKKLAKNFQNSLPSRSTINILILSRGEGSYLDLSSHQNLVETTINTIRMLLPNHCILIKKHPREIDSHWNNFENEDSIKIVNDHMLKIATQADFVISFWGSGAMDCYCLDVPVIEYFDPNKHNKQQVRDGGSFTTIYRKLGIVCPANNEQELHAAIYQLINSDFKKLDYSPHPFFQDLIERSNQWQEILQDIFESCYLAEK
ncbi:MAG: hypothetical protein VW894_00120 [Gammaproteobacteria bacterium]